MDAEARTGNPDARRYLDCWIRIGDRARREHYPEQICELAHVSAADLVTWVSRQAFLEGASDVSMCMTFKRGPVLAKVADFAMESAENGRHAELFMKAAGLLPTGGRGGGPAPMSFAPPGTSSMGSVAGVKSDSAPPDDLADMDSEIVELSKVMQTGSTACAAEEREDDDEDDDEDDNGDAEE